MSNVENILKRHLSEGDVLVVKFIKKNGDERVMRCTRNMALIPQSPVKESDGGAGDAKPRKPRKQPEGVAVVWDLEKGGWRSFQYESVQSVSVVED